MRNYFLILTFFLYSLFAFNTYAGENPISWSLSPVSGFPAETDVGSTYVVTYTLTNNMPFASPLSITRAYTGGNYVVTNECNGTLAPKGQPYSSCLIHIALQPIGARQNAITLTMAYGNNRVPLPTLTTTSIAHITEENIVGHVTSPLPAVTYTGDSYTVAFSFVNDGTLPVTATSININGFTATTNTCTGTLAPTASPCVVSGTYTPSATGLTVLSVTYVYSGGSVQKITETDVRSSGNTCLHAQAVLPLPLTSFIYADNVVKYTFTNNCNTQQTIGVITLSADGAATLTKSYNPNFTTCTPNKILSANGGNCSVLVSVVPTAMNPDLSVTAEASIGNTILSSATTSSAINAIPALSASSNHTVYFVNQCDEKVWYEFANNGAYGTPQGDPTPPSERGFLNYQMGAQLTGAAPSTKTLTFPAYINGGIYGRTKCDSTLGYCKTANCTINSSTDWSCKQGVGALPPATAIEEYMSNTTDNDGVYDISVINGFNIAAEMKSLSLINPNNNVFTQACGQAAGAVIQPTGSILGNATWSFNPASSGDSASNFIWVSEGSYDNCVSGCDPANGSYCGIGFSSLAPTTGAGTQPLNKRCGAFRGYFQVQSYNPYPNNSDWGGGAINNLYTYYQLNDTLTGYCTMGGSTATVYDMYTCPQEGQTCLLTGYNAGNIKACGCVNYSFTGSASPCLSPNTDWITRVYPRVSWLKTAAPTAYTYQYDDPSSSFTCQMAGQKTSYQITYCPAGQKGLPT
ncbi:MAG: Thaumatin domain-containing protein [Gammaproteobacteria bacterium]|nr:Thaumatin domain-containing protein [Gammaproteobacteria bacterium]